jgi:hypothetical protein
MWKGCHFAYSIKEPIELWQVTFRKLRTWSVLWGVVAVLLIALWVKSY